MPVLIFTFVSLGYRPTTTDDVHSLAWHPLPPTHLLAYRQWVKVVALVDTARPLLIALAVHRRSRWVASADGAGTSTAAYWGTTSGIDDDNFGVQVYECIDGCICSMESCLSRMQHAGNCKVDVFCCQLHRISSTICLSKYQQCLGKGEIIIQSKQTQSRSLSLLSSLGSCGWVAREKKILLKVGVAMMLLVHPKGPNGTERRTKTKRIACWLPCESTMHCTEGHTTTTSTRTLTTWLRQKQLAKIFSWMSLLTISN